MGSVYNKKHTILVHIFRICYSWSFYMLNINIQVKSQNVKVVGKGEAKGMNIQIFSILRKINRYRKTYWKQKAGEIMSSVRRIEFVAPPKERICAMTFDDGPSAAPSIPDQGRGELGLTAHLLDVLRSHNATATFCVVGSTKDNYPDEKGALHSHNVFGTKYDHYANFDQDHLAGVEACPDLLKRIVEEGHEVANHSFRHRIFGPEYFVYSKRVFCRDFDEVVADLEQLHGLVKSLSGYEMKLARPPHYVDEVGRFGWKTAYSAYARMGYHYVAASADGGGYLPTCGDYDKDVEAMVRPLREILEGKPDGLSGALIFQKDGYNMSIESPIADALDLQLKLLAEYGYRVVGVSELMKISPFEDVHADDACLQAVCDLDTAGYCIGFQNNTFRPDAPITKEQLFAMFSKSQDFNARRISQKSPLTETEIQDMISQRFGHSIPVSGRTRRDAVLALWEAVNMP